MRRFFLLICFLGTLLSAVAQVNPSIKSRSFPRFSNSSRSSDLNPCISLCASGCFDYSIWFFADVVIRGHKNLLFKKNEVPRVISFEIHPSAGISPNAGGYTLMPRVRGNWGAFSTEFRYFGNIESGLGYIDTYTTLDWQFLKLNLVQIPNFQLDLGGGIMHERYSGTTFPEFTAGMGFYFNQDRYALRFEGRIAPDYEYYIVARSEIGTHFAYRIVEGAHSAISLTVGGFYQNYYQSVGLFGLLGGMRFEVF